MEFDYNPQLHLTRLLHDQLQQLPDPARQRFGSKSLSCLGKTAANLIAVDSSITTDLNSLNQFARDLFAGLNDMIQRLYVAYPSLCQSDYAVELFAYVWKNTSGANHTERLNKAVFYLEGFGKWLGRDGLNRIQQSQSYVQQLINIYEAVLNLIPKQVFLARWYPGPANGDADHKADLRLRQIKQTLKDIKDNHGIFLDLIDMGTQQGGTYMIHPKMYDAIKSSDIILIDLTGHRPNVYAEAGFALNHHNTNKLIFLFEPQNSTDVVYFDLNTFKYEQISQAAEIPDKLKPDILSILRSSGATI